MFTTCLKYPLHPSLYMYNEIHQIQWRNKLTERRFQNQKGQYCIICCILEIKKFSLLNQARLTHNCNGQHLKSSKNKNTFIMHDPSYFESKLTHCEEYIFLFYNGVIIKYRLNHVSWYQSYHLNYSHWKQSMWPVLFFLFTFFLGVGVGGEVWIGRKGVLKKEGKGKNEQIISYECLREEMDEWINKKKNQWPLFYKVLELMCFSYI